MKVAEPAVTVNFSLPASTDASVDLPEPLGPMMACTSPALTSRSIPLRISLPSTEACRFFTLNISFLSVFFRFTFPARGPKEAPRRIAGAAAFPSAAGRAGATPPYFQG